jgi:peptidoglycan-associated lipoprotein
MERPFFVLAALMGFIWLGLNGCATRGYVKEQLTETQRLIKANQAEIARLKEVSEEQKGQLEKISTRSEQGFTLSEEALARAVEADKVAKGKLLYEVTFTDEAVHFAFDKSNLSEEARAALDSFAGRLKSENKGVYIEIQGHTDNIGTEEYNLGLGRARAEAIYSYLHTQHGIPLHRMNTFSYGESKPIADNNNPTNRAMNRRVTLVLIE